MRKLLLATCVLGLLCTRAFADSAPHWLQVQTPHFLVITDSNEREARHVAGQFERMQGVFAKLIPNARVDTGSPIIVLALKDKRGFQALEPASYLGKNQLDLAGYFMPAQDRSYILLRLDAAGEHPFATVYHEYTHYITRNVTLAPLWLSEGLAEFYQNTDIDSKEVVLGQPSSDDILYLREHSLLPLPTLFMVDHNSPYYHDEQKGSVFYAESWALMHYIQTTDFANKVDRLSLYLHNLAQHQDPVTAAQNAFGDLKKLQSQLQSYVNQANYQAFKMKSGVTVDEAAFQVDALATADADAIRADVLTDNGREEDARKLLDPVLAANPQSAQAHESMGALCLRNHDVPCARKWYAAAVSLHSSSFLAYYYAAALSLQMGDSKQSEAEDYLKQSIKLNPKFAPANDALARLYMMHHMKLDDALQYSVIAVQLEPGELAYRLNNAQLHMERNEIPSALSVLATARQIAKTPEEISDIEIRTRQIQAFQAQQDQMKHYAAMQGGMEAAGSDRVSTTSTVALSTGGPSGRTVIRPAVAADTDPHYPTAPAGAARHTAKGILRGVSCSYPTILTLTVDGSGKQVSLYTNNMYKVEYSTGNFVATKDLDPCHEFEGMKASVTYAEVTDKRVAGQILAIEVSR